MTRCGLALCLLAASLAAPLAAPLAAQQAGAPWDWQLQAPLDLAAPVATIGLDPDEVTAADIAALHARGVTTICYVSIGTVEDWRSDATDFAPQVIGRDYAAWPGERFLDLRRADLLVPLMQARFARCAAMGFDAVEPDNMDVHANLSGFAVTGADVVAYVRTLADIAHGLGLQIGQKNAPDLTADLAPYLDFIITENCLTDGWCDQIAIYAATGRAILAAEYDIAPDDQPAYCRAALAGGMSMIFKSDDLDGSGSRCG